MTDGEEPSTSSGHSSPENITVPDVFIERQKLSCAPKFDALWSCYSPGYQLQQYYRYGNVEDCLSKWSELYNCLKLKTKFAPQVELKDTENPMWKLRSKQEAESFWKAEFGHLKKKGEAQEAVQSSDQKQTVPL